MYPRLFLRVKAMMLDGVVLGIFFILLGILANELGITSDSIKVLFIILPLLCFEPLMVTLTGGSVGHHAVGIKVVRASDYKKLGVGWSFIRFLVKLPLGLYSVAGMWLTKKHRAVHDLASMSLMVFKKPETVPEYYQLHDREFGYDGKPSMLRRLGIAFCYMLLLMFIWEVMINVTVTQRCIYDDVCTQVDIERIILMNWVVLALFLIVLMLSMLCKMPGARVRKSE